MKYANHLIAAAVAATFTAAALAQSPAPAAAPAKAPAPAAKPAAAAKAFDTPQDAAKALAEAVRAGSKEQLLAVVGPSSASWIFSGDPAADKNDWMRFLASYDKKNSLDTKDAAKATLLVGEDDWPFPAPIVKKGAKWSFDASAGREEVINRRVGRNELDTIQTMLAIVDAQREYAAGDFDKNGFADYAIKFRSSPGKKDGLWWPKVEGQPESPLGPIAATAAKEGYKEQALKEGPQPYHGYYYRIIAAQGKDAPGGAYDYKVGDKLLGGFAVVAFPATYGVSGVMTFIVNHEGVVYQKDLGKQTTGIASNMSRYNPDPTWRKAE